MIEPATNTNFLPDGTSYEEWYQAIAEVLPNVDEEAAKNVVAKKLHDFGFDTVEALEFGFHDCYPSDDKQAMHKAVGIALLEESVEYDDQLVPEDILECIDWEHYWDKRVSRDVNTFDFAGNTYVFWDWWSNKYRQ